MARFFVPKKNLRETRGLIDGQEFMHLKKVLRLGPGDRITVFDDSGWEHDAVIRGLSAQQGEIEILRSYEASRESPLQITLAVALTKAKRWTLSWKRRPNSACTRFCRLLPRIQCRSWISTRLLRAPRVGGRSP